MPDHMVKVTTIVLSDTHITYYLMQDASYPCCLKLLYAGLHASDAHFYTFSHLVSYLEILHTQVPIFF